MTLPRKKKGFRKITINGINFNWRLDYLANIIDIRSGFNKNNKLIVDFGWFDIWLYVNDRNRPEAFEPEIVIPAFIKRAIQLALENNWDFNCKIGIMKLKYRENIFTIER